MYFYQIKCCVYTQNGCMNKKILQRLIPSQIPDRFSKLLCSTAVPYQINKTLSLENFRRHGATPRFSLHDVNI